MVNQSQFIERYGNSPKQCIGDIAKEWSKGQPFKKDNIIESGSTPCIHYGELFTKYGPYIDDVCSATNDAAMKVSQVGDILFPASDVTPNGLTRCSAIMRSGVLLGGDIIILRLREGLSPEYTSYAICMQKQQLLECITGSVIKHLSAKSILNVKVPIPANRKDQDAFVAIMRQADKSKFAGFKSQFISQFGFPQDGDVKHPTSSIESLLEETISGEWGTDCTDDSGARVIRTTNFTNDGILNLDDVVLRSIDQKKVEKKHLHKGDIILEKSGGTKDNPVGRLVYFAEDGIYLANNFTQVLRPSNSVNSRYLFAALYYLYQTHKPLIKGLGNQTNGIQNLKVPQYLQLQVCVPDRKEQDAFEQVLQHVDKSKYLN